jgi:hypothetical protein
MAVQGPDLSDEDLLAIANFEDPFLCRIYFQHLLLEVGLVLLQRDRSRTEDGKAPIKQAIAKYSVCGAVAELKRERRVVGFGKSAFAHGKARTD